MSTSLGLKGVLGNYRGGTRRSHGAHQGFLGEFQDDSWWPQGRVLRGSKKTPENFRGFQGRPVDPESVSKRFQEISGACQGGPRRFQVETLLKSPDTP